MSSDDEDIIPSCLFEIYCKADKIFSLKYVLKHEHGSKPADCVQNWCGWG